jgi:type IV pilus assembly protein PilM
MPNGEEATWTRAVSFAPSSEPEAVTEPAALEAVDVPVEQVPSGEEATWTRAVSFAPSSEPEAVPEPPAPERVDAPVEQVPSAEESHEVVAVSGSDPETRPEQPAAVEPVAEAAPPVEPPSTESHEVVAGSGSDPVTLSAQSAGPQETDPEEATWTRAVSFGRKSEPGPVAEPPVVGSDPESGPQEAGAEEATWTRAVSFGRKADAEPVAAEPVAATSPEPAPEVHAPVIADELAQLDSPEPEQKVPFWKKEIGGKKKDKAPKPKPEPVAQAVPAPDGEKKVPFWKKEIGGKKKHKAPKPQPEPVVETVALAPDTEKKVPFWRKEIGGKKDKAPKPKAERAPKAPKEKKPKQPKPPKVKSARGSRGAKRITGLKVGASQLAAARVANNGSAELLQIARTPLDPGIVVGGELRDPDALAEALKAFFAANNLPKKGVRLGIANNRIGVRTFDIAGIEDEKQLANAIRFRAQEALPIPIDEAVLDYQVLGDGTSEDGQPTKRVLLVVAYRELIDRYMDACKKAGISLMGIDLEAFALLRALQAPQQGEEADAALVAVAIGHDRSTFAVSDGRICEFTRVLEWGGAALNVAIARALDAAPSEVDGVKRALALTDEMVPEGLTPEQAQKAREAMRRAIQTFARELVSSLQYYQNQPGSLGIGEIVLTGGTAHLAGLAGELERLIGVRVRVGDPLGRMKVSKKVGEAEQVGSLAVAIGLGIED